MQRHEVLVATLDHPLEGSVCQLNGVSAGQGIYIYIEYDF